MVTETFDLAEMIGGSLPAGASLDALLTVAGVDPTEYLGADDAAVLAVAPVKVATEPTPPAPAGEAPAFTVPAGVPVFAITEADARRPMVWGRCLKRASTSRVNHFAGADLVEVRATGYVFRLRPNAQGLALLMVPAEHVRAA